MTMKTYFGTVVLRPWAAGSKSAMHDVAHLDLGGQCVRLAMDAAPKLRDATLDALAGKRVQVVGELSPTSGTLFVDTLEEFDGA